MPEVVKQDLELVHFYQIIFFRKCTKQSVRNRTKKLRNGKEFRTKQIKKSKKD